MSWNKIFNPISKRYVNLNSKKGLEIMNNYLDHYRGTHTGGAGVRPGARGRDNSGPVEPQWVFDMNDEIVRAFIEEFPGESVVGRAFFNNGITWLADSKKKIGGAGAKPERQYYGMVVRVTAYKNEHGDDITPGDLQRLLQTAETQGFNYIGKDAIIRRGNQYSSGTPINKWFPYFWEKPPNMDLSDDTYLLLWERKGDDMKVIGIQNTSQHFSNGFWDARIVNLYTANTPSPERPSGRNNEFIIMGNCRENGFSLNDRGDCVMHRGTEMEEKICSLKFNFDSESKINRLLPGESLKGIAPCLTKYDSTEKNYSLIYLHYEDTDRKWSTTAHKKGFLVHFHMTRAGTSGNVFFWAPSTASSDTDDVLNNRTEWEQILPANSNFFQRYEAEFNRGVAIAGVRYFKSRISCTTPLLKIDYPHSGAADARTSRKFIAVGHFKINWVAYLNKLIKDAGSEGHPTVQSDQLYKFYINEMAPRLRTKVKMEEYQISINKAVDFRMAGPIYARRRGCCPPHFLDHRTYPEFFNMVVSDGAGGDGPHGGGGWIIDGTHGGRDHWGTVNFLHPHYIYFGFFYVLNYKSLELEYMSDFFVIGHGEHDNDRGSAFLSFPTGITTNDDNYWVSYGDGDSKSLLASWNKDQIRNLCKHRINRTRDGPALKFEDLEFKYLHD